jgi:oxalate decarboxylase/phosphoglucose isomerase-like protein (cupin superfamily)
MGYIAPVQASPRNYRLLLENERVRVLEMRLPSGQRDERHSHPAETVYFVKGGKARIMLEDGGAADVDLPDGHVMWHEPWTHQVENVGTSDIYAVIVESKAGQ